MIARALCLLLLLGSAPLLRAQWLSKTYPLADGWNSVWLSGDASHATIDEQLAAYPNISEIWRWNPNPDQITFTTSPSESATHAEEWTIWKRGDTNEQRLNRLVGNSAYLVFSEGATSLVIKQRPIPPAASWQISGANFLGFPARAKAPTFTSYFASFPSASSTVLSPASKIFKYTGGPLSATNPQQIAPNVETVNPDAAYWFDTATVSDFTAPLEYELPSDSGLAFGRALTAITIGVTNRSTTSLTLNVSLESSEPAPAGQPGVSGGVALTRRVFDSASGSYAETPVGAGFTVTIPASGRLNLEFGIDRSGIADAEAFHASILRVRDTSELTDARFPVTAQAATPTGLWIARATVSAVASNVPGATGDSVKRPFVLPFLIHVDGNGDARLLSQAFVGRLASGGNPMGLAVSEEAILSHAKSDIPPRRYVSPQMPLTPYILGSGSVAAGSTVAWQIPIAFDDPTNPFVHAYHPDHDNLDASFSAPLEDGEESYTIGRDCRFTFTSEPPDGSSVSGWGATILGGYYEETLTGLNAQPLEVGGAFSMRRISEIADIDLTPPAN